MKASPTRSSNDKSVKRVVFSCEQRMVCGAGLNGKLRLPVVLYRSAGKNERTYFISFAAILTSPVGRGWNHPLRGLRTIEMVCIGGDVNRYWKNPFNLDPGEEVAYVLRRK
jgi:hypothetical protein